ncbi:MAG TPA: carbohydrate-binding protein [Candidatus Angelobacter sp.]
MKSTKISAIRFYARDPGETAKFYSMLGFEMVGGEETGNEPYDFPVYASLNHKPMIEIYRADGAVPPSSSTMMIVVEVSDPRGVIERLRSLGFSVERKEPRITDSSANCIVSDPEGTLVGLDNSFFTAFGGGIPSWQPLTPTVYSPGQLVRYDGRIYKCIQHHSAEENKTPPEVPKLWEQAVFS